MILTAVPQLTGREKEREFNYCALRAFLFPTMAAKRRVGGAHSKVNRE